MKLKNISPKTRVNIRTMVMRTILAMSLTLIALVSSMFLFSKPHAAAAMTGTVYVMDSGRLLDGNISVVNAATNTITKRILVGGTNVLLLNHTFVTTPNHAKVYVVGYTQANNSPPTAMLYDINTASNTVTNSIALSDTVDTVAVNPVAPYIYVIGSITQDVVEIDTISTVTDTITATTQLSLHDAAGESNAIVNSTGKRLYFVAEPANQLEPLEVSVVDLTSNSIVDTIGPFPASTQNDVNQGGPHIRQLGLSSDNTQLFVGAGTQSIDIVTIATHAVVNQIPFGGFFLQASNGNLAYGVSSNDFVKLDPSKAYVGAVTAIKQGGTYWNARYGFSPNATISSDGSTIYVTDAEDNALEVVNIVKQTISAIIPMGLEPSEVLYLP